MITMATGFANKKKTMSLVESWQDCAFKEDGYTAKPIYSVILSLLVRNGRYLASKQ